MAMASCLVSEIIIHTLNRPFAAPPPRSCNSSLGFFSRLLCLRLPSPPDFPTSRIPSESKRWKRSLTKILCSCSRRSPSSSDVRRGKKTHRLFCFPIKSCIRSRLEEDERSEDGVGQVQPPSGRQTEECAEVDKSDGPQCSKEKPKLRTSRREYRGFSLQSNAEQSVVTEWTYDMGPNACARFEKWQIYSQDTTMSDWEDAEEQEDIVRDVDGHASRKPVLVGCQLVDGNIHSAKTKTVDQSTTAGGSRNKYQVPIAETTDQLHQSIALERSCDKAKLKEQAKCIMKTVAGVAQSKSQGNVGEERRPEGKQLCTYTTVSDLAKLDAKMDMKFEQVLRAIEVVSEQAQTSFGQNVRDRRAQVACSTSIVNSPFEGQSHLVQAFQEAVAIARHKLRVLSGLLFVETDVKLTSRRDFHDRTMILARMMRAYMVKNACFQHAWHLKYGLDHCMNSIFFQDNLDSMSAASPSVPNSKAQTNFSLFCMASKRAMETFAGTEERQWSENLRNMFWESAMCSWNVHTLFTSNHGCRITVKSFHPAPSTSFEESTMDPLDSGDLQAFHPTVMFTIFSGFMLDESVLCKPQVYLQPKIESIRLFPT